MSPPLSTNCGVQLAWSVVEAWLACVVSLEVLLGGGVGVCLANKYKHRSSGRPSAERHNQLLRRVT